MTDQEPKVLLETIFSKSVSTKILALTFQCWKANRLQLDLGYMYLFIPWRLHAPSLLQLAIGYNLTTRLVARREGSAHGRNIWMDSVAFWHINFDETCEILELCVLRGNCQVAWNLKSWIVIFWYIWLFFMLQIEL